MACYKPQLAHFIGYDDSGKPKYKFIGQHVSHTSDPELSDPRDILIPCKKCIGCRLDYSRQWATRLMLELDHSKTALFLTLTYDDDHLTPATFDDTLGCFWYTLVKRDLQLFNKRLRYFFRHKEIRFYSVGEYGSQTLRPHYHGIYFGLSLDDFPDIQPLFLNEFKQQIYTSESLGRIWKNGHVSIGNVSWQSCAYVARYNLKKIAHGDSSLALDRKCLPEFALMSRNPGIASNYIVDHPEFLEHPEDKIFISDVHGVKPVNGFYAPSYLMNKVKLTKPDLYASISSERRAFSEARFLKELSNTDLDEFSYLSLKESNHEKALELLKRPLES